MSGQQGREPSGVGLTLAGSGPLTATAFALRDHPGYLLLTAALIGLILIMLVREFGRLRCRREVEVTLAAVKVYRAGGDGAAVVRALDPRTGTESPQQEPVADPAVSQNPAAGPSGGDPASQ